MGQVRPRELVRTTVLVADDDGDVRTMLRTFLELEGYRVLEAVDGNQAWTAIQSQRPDLVIVDLNMPGHGGLALARLVKTNGPRSTRLIAYTAGVATEEECLAAGYDGYFLKTDPLRRLSQTIKQLVGA